MSFPHAPAGERHRAPDDRLTDRQLTPHFRLSDFTVSAAHPDLVRPVPGGLEVDIAELAMLLETIRARVQRDLVIVSGYRSPVLNDKQGGTRTSQHVIGQAVDWTCFDVRAAFERVLELVYDGELSTAGQIVYYPARERVHLALASKKFPRPTTCVHWPERGMKYRPFTPNKTAFAQLVPETRPEPLRRAEA